MCTLFPPKQNNGVKYGSHTHSVTGAIKVSEGMSPDRRREKDLETTKMRMTSELMYE